MSASDTAAKVLEFVASIGDSSASLIPSGPARVAVGIVSLIASVASAAIRAGDDPVVAIRRVVDASPQLDEVHKRWETRIAAKAGA